MTRAKQLRELLAKEGALLVPGAYNPLVARILAQEGFPAIYAGGYAAAAAGHGLRMTVIMPVYNAVGFLEQTLPPLLAMGDRGEVLEVVVVDDGSSDGSAEVARGLGAQVIRTGGRSGPGAARNLAAR